MSSNIIIVLLILTAFQCAVFSLFLLRARRWRRLSNAALAVMLILQCIQMATLAAQWAGLLRQGENLNLQFGLLYGPCALFYVRGLLYDRPVLGVRSGSHLVPFLAASALWYLGGPSWRLTMPVVIVSFGLYLAACAATVRRYRRIVDGTRSESHGFTLRWLRFILGLWGGIFVLYGMLYASLLAGLMAGYSYISIGLYATLLVSTAALIFAALEHPLLFKPVSPEESGWVSEPAGNSAAPDAEDQRVAARISAAMTQARLYLQPDLSLPQLAAKLGLPPRRVSAAINRCFRQNFSDYVNSQRIEAAKRRLTDPAAAGESILVVLYATGFNSKSVFNAAFKLKTGVSPSRYRAEHGPSGK